MGIRGIGLVAMLVVVATGILVSAQFECRGNLTKIVVECKKYVMKGGPMIPPSKACCDALKAADLPCLCKYIPPGIGNIISFEKAIYVAQTCGLKIPPGTKCGNFTVPPAPAHGPSPPPPHRV